MEEIKVGEYVRTKQGYIGKVVEIEDYGIEFDNYIVERYSEKFQTLYFGEDMEEIVDHSSNAIDLVYPDDYVNGYRIVEVHKDPFNGKMIASTEIMKIDCWGDRYLVQFHEEDIESIVTKEQFKAIQYERRKQ